MQRATGSIFAEEPLEGAVDQGGVRFEHDGTIEPEMRAEDRDAFEFVERGEAVVLGCEGGGNPTKDGVVVCREDNGICGDHFATLQLYAGDAEVVEM